MLGILRRACKNSIKEYINKISNIENIDIKEIELPLSLRNSQFTFDYI